MISSLFVGCAIHKNKKYQGHPNKLIMFLSFSNLSSVWHLVIWHVGTSDFACYLKIASITQLQLEGFCEIFGGECLLIDTLKLLS